MLHILAHCHGLLAKREKKITKWASSFYLNSGDHKYAPMQFHFNFQESKWETLCVCVCLCDILCMLWAFSHAKEATKFWTPALWK